MKIMWKDTEKPGMNINQKGDVVYLTYSALEELPGIRHAFSTRLGGVSKEHLASMNLSFSRGDLREHVLENYDRFGAAVGFRKEDVVMSDQTHTTNIRVVTEADRGCGMTKEKTYRDVDGMVTNVPGLVLTTFYADCVPLFLVDPVTKSIGLVHSGWRGTAGKIGAEAVRTMQETYGTKAEDLYAAIGPSICMDCYEVSEDVILEFSGTFSSEDLDAICIKKQNGKYQLNLWEANRRVLTEMGIQNNHISLPNLCTCCNPDFLFSHRASQGKRGNLAAFLEICE